MSELSTFDREMLLADCREANRHDVPRTDAERAELVQLATEAARKLGYESYEDVL